MIDQILKDIAEELEKVELKRVGDDPESWEHPALPIVEDAAHLVQDALAVKHPVSKDAIGKAIVEQLERLCESKHAVVSGWLESLKEDLKREVKGG